MDKNYLLNSKELTTEGMGMTHREMRRSLKKLKDETKINELLATANVGYLGLVDKEGTYVVPLNFVWKDQKIYFHGSEEGRKADAIPTLNRVCFTVAEDNGIITRPTAANIGTAYKSVMVFGRVKELDNLAEATAALQAMLDKYVPGYFERGISQKYVDSYRSAMGSKTVIHCIEPDQITAKEAIAEPEQLFFFGRKQVDDLKKKH